MPERVLPGPIEGSPSIKEAVCIHTNKVYDSCRDKDCLEDLRLFATVASQQVIDRAINVKCRKAELIWVFIDVERVPFNRGFYTVDVKFYYKITLDCFTGVGRPSEAEGLCCFDKRAILFGSEGNAKIFSSAMSLDAVDAQMIQKTNMPKAVVEAVDPIFLGVKIVDMCDHHCAGDCVSEIPTQIAEMFGDELQISDAGRRVYCTLGQFSIIKLERNSQLLIPAFDYCMPDKDCAGPVDRDPCELFSRIRFPVDEFFPPNICRDEDSEEAVSCCGE